MPFLPLPIPGLPIPMYFLKGLSFRTAVTRTPFPSSSNNSRSPAFTPSLRRISRGTVTCPLLVTLACFFIANLYSLLYHRTPYIYDRPSGHCLKRKKRELNSLPPGNRNVAIRYLWPE